jgi:putative transcriptional regulator
MSARELITLDFEAEPRRRRRPPRAPQPKPPRPPTPSEIRAAREAAGLTQTEAAALVYKTCRAWQLYESGERSMDPAYWELFQQKVAAGCARAK